MDNNLIDGAVQLFKEKIWNFYKENYRNFSWRENISPYRVVVSEVMLQQTQTARVVKKFEQWIQAFPTFKALATASVDDVLVAWQGLGYNRRALALYGFAKRVQNEFGGKVPQDIEVLQLFNGIGPNTAGSICTFAFNMPSVFIETNVRTVFLYHFFSGKLNVSDKEILLLVEKTVDKDRPRDWYYALMDYGVFLKAKLKVSNATSLHYKKQSKFIGSRRQVRGAIIKILVDDKKILKKDLVAKLAKLLAGNAFLFDNSIFEELEKEGFLSCKNGFVQCV